MVYSFLDTLTNLPTLTRFALVLALFLFVPKLCERFGFPAAVGLLAAGWLVGATGLGVAPETPPVAAFFSEIGKLLLMFFAGLEIDITQFNRTRNRSLVFGALTFALPLLAGIGVGRQFGYE